MVLTPGWQPATGCKSPRGFSAVVQHAGEITRLCLACAGGCAHNRHTRARTHTCGTHPRGAALCCFGKSEVRAGAGAGRRQQRRKQPPRVSGRLTSPGDGSALAVAVIVGGSMLLCCWLPLPHHTGNHAESTDACWTQQPPGEVRGTAQWGFPAETGGKQGGWWEFPRPCHMQVNQLHCSGAVLSHRACQPGRQAHCWPHGPGYGSVRYKGDAQGTRGCV